MMQKIIPLFILFLLSFNQLSGQWYYRHHNVTDPDSLTLEQFNISHEKASGTMKIGGLLVGAGTVSWLLIPSFDDGRFLPSDAQLKLFMFGLISITAGIIVFSSGAIMNHNINRSMRTKFSETGYLKIQPSLIRIQGKGIGSGVTFTFSF